MFLPVFLAFWVIFFFYHFYWKRRGFPPGPTPLPFVGNIFHFDISNAEQQLLEYRRKYGKMFTLWLPEPYVFFGDFEMMKTYFKRDELSGRPEMEGMKLFIGGNYGMVINENLWWRSQRRFGLHVLRDFGVGKPVLENACIEEGRKLVEDLNRAKGNPVCLLPYVLTAVGNIIHQLVFGSVREYDDPFFHDIARDFKIVADFFNSPTMFLIEQFGYKPALYLQKIFDYGLNRVIKSNDSILDVVQEEIDCHKKTVIYDQPPRDYIDAYLFEMKRREEEGRPLEEFTEHQLKASLYDLFFAGMETTVTTLRHAILHMIRSPKIQARIHKEIDEVIGREKEICMSDQKLLPYVNATIQEVQRISNVVTLNVPHCTTEDIVVEGYSIPKKTVVIPQYSIVHVDPKEFAEPGEFLPDRFINANGEFVKDERVIPFSIGKRACLGEGLARMELFIYFATLMQKFEFHPEVEGRMPPLDMSVKVTKTPKPYLFRAITRV
ncbi:hypothetical protein QR680_007640 [Steinernema hermaphroditum]|uniref:Cytochrome P450 n=1 Tax=Steinernema hermaphroditum TaxID=289476 RepID=A0AA39IG08_9BILA|nr:hypothetical protein QR680_007640 [Steinernema hermaphroditum]